MKKTRAEIQARDMKLSPLWASGAGAYLTGDNNNKGNNMTEKEVAQLQARKAELEQKVASLQAKDDAVSKAELRAARSELTAANAQLALEASNQKIAALEAAEGVRRKEGATLAVARMVKSGQILAQEAEKQEEWQRKFEADPSLIPLVARAEPAPEAQPLVAGGGRMLTPGPNSRESLEANAAYDTMVRGGFDLRKALATYYGLIQRNCKVPYHNQMALPDALTAARSKGVLALDAANFFNRELKPHLKDWEHIPMVELGKLAGVYGGPKGSGAVQAADFNDPNNNLGVLSGTLVLQRTLPFFAFDYPELLSLYTDFSDTPGILNQAENTRIILQPAVQKYTTTLGADGRPLGWNVASPGKSTNVTLTLTDYIAVPINFGNDILGATTRKLFDEQAVLSVKAIADYFINMVVKLMTLANWTAYAVGGTTTVPVAYPTYVKDLANFAVSDLDAIGAAFTSNKVPKKERGVWLNPQYYAKLRGDPRMSFYFQGVMTAAAAGRDFVTDGMLPDLIGFKPVEAPYLAPIAGAGLPAALVGFAYHKAGVVLKSRLPNDFAQALGVMIPGSITTITDPDTKISVMLVQYVNLTQGYAEWRPEVQLGVSVGDNRGGLLITSA